MMRKPRRIMALDALTAAPKMARFCANRAIPLTVADDARKRRRFIIGAPGSDIIATSPLAAWGVLKAIAGSLDEIPA